MIHMVDFDWAKDFITKPKSNEIFVGKDDY